MKNTQEKLAVIAIGGNSLISETEPVNVTSEYKIVGETCRQVAALIADGWQVVITHGNGPQAGFNLRRCELAAHELFELSMDVIVAFTQGSIGYYIQQNLNNILMSQGLARQVVTLITQVEVDLDDKAFERPSKPIGGYIDRDKAREFEREGWPMSEEPGKGWRRVVSSPMPKRILEEDTISNLLSAGCVVVACGGGGIAVAEDVSGNYGGVPAIIDKDFASALLAQSLGAELLIISTAVDRVALHYGKPEQTWLDEIDINTATQYMAQNHFPEGSMAPKVQAAIDYLNQGGRRVIITNPASIYDAVAGSAGTHIVP